MEIGGRIFKAGQCEILVEIIFVVKSLLGKSTGLYWQFAATFHQLAPLSSSGEECTPGSCGFLYIGLVWSGNLN